MTDKRSIFVFNDEQDRVNLVKAMHHIVVSLNDEQPYYGIWVDYIPDEPSEYDFVAVATDDELLDELIEEFRYIVNKYLK